MDLTYRIEVFEGPLDLLLSLIAKNKMNIADIKISLIFEQYMEYIDKLKQLDMEITGEFITMAAELMLIKSRMLLPRDEEQEEDPRERLALALLEYQKAKVAAKYLGGQYEVYRDRYAKDTSEISVDGKILPQESFVLFEMMSALLERSEDQRHSPTSYVTPIIKRKYIPVGSCVPRIVELMKQKKRLRFFEFFEHAESRSELIATFLALLELIKAGNVCISLDEDDEPSFSFDPDVPMPEVYLDKEEDAQ